MLPVVLPVLEHVAWVGWPEDKALEEDLWEELRALRRRCEGGWSETEWRRWLVQVAREREARDEWWETMTWWCRRRGCAMGGDNVAQERVLAAMVDEEMVRRWAWWEYMRNVGWGEKSWEEWLGEATKGERGRFYWRKMVACMEEYGELEDEEEMLFGSEGEEGGEATGG